MTNNELPIPGIEDPYFSIEKEYGVSHVGRPYYEHIGEVARSEEEISLQLAWEWKESGQEGLSLIHI